MNNKFTVFGGVLVLMLIVGGIAYASFSPKSEQPVPSDIVQGNVTLSGTYECLPHLDTSGPQTMECAFGFVTDSGDHYAVNFGQSADAMTQFQSGSHITAQGFVVPKEALSSDQWQKYNMKGIFTVNQVLSTSTPTVGAKININAVCEGALAYMTFTDSAAANAFVADCKDGKHSEVIDQYKAQMHLDGAAI